LKFDQYEQENELVNAHMLVPLTVVNPLPFHEAQLESEQLPPPPALVLPVNSEQTPE